MKRLVLVALLLVGCSKHDEQAKLDTARAKAAEAQERMREAQVQAAKAQHEAESAIADEKAAEQGKADLEKDLADAQQQTKDLLALAAKKVEALKKQRATLADGPQRKAIDDQIEQLEKVIRDTQPPKP